MNFCFHLGELGEIPCERFAINLLRVKLWLFDLKTHSVPRSKQFASVINTNLLM